MRARLLVVALVLAAVPGFAQRGTRARTQSGPGYAKLKTKARATMQRGKADASNQRKSIPKLQSLLKQKHSELRSSENAEMRSQVKELRSLRQQRKASAKSLDHHQSRTNKLRAEQKKAEGAGKRSIRNVTKWFSKAGRAQLRASRGARKRAKRILRLVQISERSVARASEAIARIDKRATRLEASFRQVWGQRSSRGKRARSAAESERARLETKAVAIENAAKEQVRNMVLSWAAEHLPSYQKLLDVKAKTKGADCAAGSCAVEADNTLSAMRKAKSRLDDASLAESADVVDNLLGDSALSTAIQTLNSVSSTMSVQDAQSAVRKMNQQIARLSDRHKELKSKLKDLGQTIKSEAPGQSRMGMTMTLEHLDLVLDLSRMQTGIMDMAFGLSTINQLDSNSRQISSAMSKTKQMVSEIKRTRSTLQKNLQKIDAESARIVDEVVKNVLQD